MHGPNPDHKTIGRPAWLALVTMFCTVVTYVTLVIWATFAALWSGGTLDARVLRQDPLDPNWLLAMAITWGLFGLEFLTHGWQSHPLRRFLFQNRPDDQTNLFYLIANLTGLSLILEVVLSGGRETQAPQLRSAD